MSKPESGSRGGGALHWIARITGTLLVVLLAFMVFGESGGNGPSGPREWAYLTLFPFGFSVGYVLGWRWPLVGGYLSLACMVASQFVVGRVFDVGAYLIWGLLSVPGVLYVLVGWRDRAREHPAGGAEPGPLAGS